MREPPLTGLLLLGQPSEYQRALTSHPRQALTCPDERDDLLEKHIPGVLEKLLDIYVKLRAQNVENLTSNAFQLALESDSPSGDSTLLAVGLHGRQAR